MKNITIKMHNVNQIVQQIQAITKDGEPTVLVAQKGINYELIDEETGHALQHIVTKRVDKDLHISSEGNGQEPDIIIENFYSYNDSALIGLAEEGNYYNYIPDTAHADDYITQLNNGDIEGQALGGNASAEPWWVANTSHNHYFPLMVGVGFAGGVFALEKNNSSNSNNGLNASNINKNMNLADYHLPEHIAKALDEETVASMKNAENLATNTTPKYEIADVNDLPSLDSLHHNDNLIETSNTQNAPPIANTLTDIYAVYPDIALPIILDTETPII